MADRRRRRQGQGGAVLGGAGRRFGRWLVGGSRATVAVLLSSSPAKQIRGGCSDSLLLPLVFGVPTAGRQQKPVGKSPVATGDRQLVSPTTIPSSKSSGTQPTTASKAKGHSAVSFQFQPCRCPGQDSTRPTPAFPETISPDPNLLPNLVHATVVSFQLTRTISSAHHPLRPIYTHTHTATPTPSTHPPLLLTSPAHTTPELNYIQLPRGRTELFAAMARCGFLSLPKVVLLLVVLIGDVAAMAMARTLLGGIAETPSPAVAAEGPGVGAPPSGRRHDRSIAGADVILVGFAAAVVAVIFLYIRVTRKTNHGAAEMAEKA